MNSAIESPQTDTAKALLTLLQLGKRARSARNPAELGFVMVNETLQLLHYRQAALLTRGTELAGAQIAAVSGAATPDSNAPYIQWLTQVMRQLLSTPGDQPQQLTSDDLDEFLGADWHHWLPEHGLWLPLCDGDKALGGVLFARAEPWGQAELALAAELGQVYQHALKALNPGQPWQLKLRERIKPTRTKAWIAGSFLAVCLFPVRLSVLAPAEVIPFEPFLVRAPLDGVVETIFVRPNEPVAADTPLFSLDTTTLQSQHAVAQQAFNAAEEEYRQVAQLAVTDDKSKLELALRRGALAEKSVELDYTAQQLGRVQVKAERAGVAVFNDVNDWQGKAVALGEKILLLADPGKVELSVDLPASDIIAIKTGDPVKLYPNASPVSSYDARVTSLAYHAEPTPSGVLAYRVKAELVKGQDLPRIGMMGTAKISGERVPFCYYLLRKPLSAARQWLGW